MAAADGRHHGVARLEVDGHLRQVREGALQAGEQVAQDARADERVLDLQQVGRQEHGAALGAVHERAQVVDAAEADIVLLPQQGEGLLGQRQPVAHCHQVVAGQEGFGQLHAAAEGAVGGKLLANLVVFEDTQGAWVHRMVIIA